PSPPTQPKETPKDTPATTPKPPPPAPPPAPPPEEKPKPWKKLPVPDEVSQARAEKTLKETYQTDYAGTKPEDKLALAAKFLQPGRENRADPAAWYVLLREARDLAVQAGRPRLALEAIREIDKWFLIDAWTMEMTAMTTLGQSVSDKNARVVVSVALGKLLDQAMTGEHYSSAKELLGIADAAAAKVVKDKKSAEVDKQLTERIAARKQEVADLEKDYQAVQDARTKLDSTPDDPQANLTLGKYLCFFQGKWEEGLPLLAKGADDHLKELAKKDLAQPKEAADQAAVASGWLALVEGEKGRNQVHLKERGLFWFEKAEPKAEGLTKTLITDQLKQLRQPPPPIPPRLMLGSFYGRDLEDRVLLLREGGGTMQSEEAVARGLEWLARHQAPTGMWSLDAFPTLGGCNCADVGEKHDIAATAFGLLPFLGAGETHLQGSHAPTVLRGLNYLLFQQKPTGNFSDNAYENALATLAVCEAYGLSQDVRLRVPAQAAVNYIIQAQDSGGSWGYSAGQAGDTSVSGWQFSALKAGVYAGLKVPLDPFNRLEHFLDTVADPDGLGYGYKTPGSGKATSAVGLLCRQYLGWGPDKPTLVKGLEQLVQTSNLPTKDNHSIYFIFYATQALHHFGGQPWEAWNGKVRDLLVDLQDQGLDPTHPHQKGSWSPRGDDYAPQGGRFMFTSLAVMSLEMYYYSVPVNGYGPAVLPD
ncbi:MAG: terpene cyclase/mutase family protein, partial [Planctomycetes bacterium]|nr:terpene cyclase/mutase family protein [Planctomycetota bacterium]